MKLIRNMFFLFAVTVFALTSTILSIYNYNPFTSGHDVFVSFYISFGFAVAGLAAIIVLYVKSRLSKKETFGPQFWPSLRQGLLVGVAATALIVLQGFRILDWLVGVSVVVVTILLELFFQTKKSVANSDLK